MRFTLGSPPPKKKHHPPPPPPPRSPTPASSIISVRKLPSLLLLTPLPLSQLFLSPPFTRSLASNFLTPPSSILHRTKKSCGTLSLACLCQKRSQTNYKEGGRSGSRDEKKTNKARRNKREQSSKQRKSTAKTVKWARRNNEKRTNKQNTTKQAHFKTKALRVCVFACALWPDL